MNLEIIKGSENYTVQVIKLPTMVTVQGLDNLVKVSVQGNECLIGKDSDPEKRYLFFPSESQISHEFLSANNLYRHSELNKDKEKKGFFDDNRRVKAVKFKGTISSGFVIPVDALDYLHLEGKIMVPELQVGNEFTSINGIEICRKYIRRGNQRGEAKPPRESTIDNIVDSKMAPEHMDTAQLMRNMHKLELDTKVAITYKLHGTSARYYNTLVKRALTWKDKVAQWFGIKVQETEYNYICASRRVVKSVGFEELPAKNHYYTEDLWTKVGNEYFKDKLNVGEAIYCEIIGKDYTGAAIQSGYIYGFDKPMVYVYRISNINAKGLEIDLTHEQMKIRAQELGLNICPEFYVGRLDQFIVSYFPHLFNGNATKEEVLEKLFYDYLLEKPSIFDSSVVEEGFCIRIDGYPKPEILKIKSRKFLLHETSLKDKEVIDIEEEQIVEETL
jgi:hypothetical protein